jgi:hypothetical protein
VRGSRCVPVVDLLVGLRHGLLRTCCVLSGRVGSRGSGRGALMGAADGYVRARCGWACACPTGALIAAVAMYMLQTHKSTYGKHRHYKSVMQTYI